MRGRPRRSERQAGGRNFAAPRRDRSDKAWRYVAATACALMAVAPSIAFAHTEPSLIAVPAGEDAVVALQPTHGCGESPTVRVRIRAPFADAQAGAVDGWTASSTPDGEGNAVLEWTGGLLPADETGSFPALFRAPATPGELLTFPAIQTCDNGEELAWISGDPTEEFPAPRVLVLPAGYEPATTLDDVPLDAPGREQLVEIIDVDNPADTTAAPTSAPSTAPVTAPPTTAAPTTGRPPATTAAPATDPPPPTTAATTGTTSAPAPETTVPADAESDSDSPIVPITIGAVVGGAIAGGVVVVRRRSS